MMPVQQQPRDHQRRHDPDPPLHFPTLRHQLLPAIRELTADISSPDKDALIHDRM
jgi:hypothetical protein